MASKRTLGKLKRNPTLDRKLVAYSAAALVALAVPGRALAAVQYTDEDPDVVVGVNDFYNIDFDNDGNAEFQLRQATQTFTTTYTNQFTTTTRTYYTTTSCIPTSFGSTCTTNTFTNTFTNFYTSTYTNTYTGNKVDLVPLNNAGDVGNNVITSGGYAAALVTSENVSSGRNFASGTNRILAGYDLNSVASSVGPFLGQTDKFLGLSFFLNGGAVRYGWVRLDVNNDAGGFTVKALAYEDEAGQPIMTALSPTAVTLAGFTATPSDAGVLLQWETTSEVDHAGFNLYRGTDAATVGEVVNEALIAAEAPGSSTGAAYQWLDSTAEAGMTYYYWLEAVDINGGTERFGPVSAIIQVPTTVSLSTLSANTSTLPQWQWMAFGVVALGAVLRRRQARRQRMRQQPA